METKSESRSKAGESINNIAKPPKLSSPVTNPHGVDKNVTITASAVDEEQILKWLALPEEND